MSPDPVDQPVGRDDQLAVFPHLQPMELGDYSTPVGSRSDRGCFALKRLQRRCRSVGISTGKVINDAEKISPGDFGPLDPVDFSGSPRADSRSRPREDLIL